MKPFILDITPRYVVDNEGNRTAVLLDIKQFEQLIADLEDHTPNEATKKALNNAKTKKGLKMASSVEDLFKKLNE